LLQSGDLCVLSPTNPELGAWFRTSDLDRELYVDFRNVTILSRCFTGSSTSFEFGTSQTEMLANRGFRPYEGPPGLFNALVSDDLCGHATVLDLAPIAPASESLPTVNPLLQRRVGAKVRKPMLLFNLVLYLPVWPAHKLCICLFSFQYSHL